MLRGEKCYYSVYVKICSHDIHNFMSKSHTIFGANLNEHFQT